MKASYNFIHACLLLSSGQTQRALACLRYAQGQTTTKAMKDVVDDQIRRLTLEGNAVQQGQEYPDDDWLAGTNVAETERLAERQRNAQQKYQSKGKHKRPKRTDKSTMSSTKTSSSTLPSSLLAIPITSLFPSSSIPMSRVSCEKTSSKDGASSSSLSVPAPSEGSLPGDDDSDDDDEEDVTSGITESRFLPREEDESADNSEDLIEQVVTLLPDSTQEDWYTTSEKIPLLAQTNIYIAEKQLHAYEKNKSKFYPELVTDQNEIEKMLKTEPNRYRHCQLVSIFPHEAEAKVIRGQTNPSQIFIHGRSRIGRTFLDEEVLVEVLAQPQGSDQNMPSSLDKMAHGQVVGSLRMVHYSDVSHPVFLCTLDEWDQNLMLPLCKTVPKLFILRKDSTLPENRARKSIDVYRITADGAIQYRDSFKLSQDRLDLYVFKVVYITWRHNRSVYPLGAVIAVHRTGKNYDTGLELLAMQQCLPTVYPAETIQHTKELVEAQGSMPSENMEDLRAKRVFTIDPPNSRDLDDALSIWKEGCHYIIGVHITDVASVVRPDLPVDVEARRRSFTFYPPNHKPHAMLPEPLSKRCSLLEGQDRLCMSLFFRVNNNGKVVDDPWVKKTVVKSCKQLTYAEVQAVLDGEDGDTDRELREDIRLLFRLTNVLHEEREKTSRFLVPFKDPRVLGLEDPSVLGLEDPRVLEIVGIKDDSKAHLLVAEWMIKANCYIAKRLREKFPNLMILRCQDAPSLKEMHEWLEKEGVVAHLPISLQDTKVTPNTTLSFSSTKLTSSSSQQSVILQSDVWRRLCRHLEDNEVSEARRLVFMDIVHPLQCLVVAHWWDLMFTAEYKCSYGLNGPEHRHFSLDVDFYTHFTSPLRRYPDLHVQRLLHADLDGTKPDCTPESVIQLCKHVNSVNKRLKCFSKSCTNLKLASRVQDQPLVFRAFLDTVETDHLKLCLPSLMHTSERNHEIPFSAMGVSRQPDINVNTMLNQATATVQWNKRIYDVKGQCPGSLRPVWGQLDRMKVAPNSADMQISRDHLSVLLKIKDWIKILKALVANDLCRINRTPHPVNHTRSEVEYMSSEKGNGKVCLRPVRYQTTFTTGQIIQLQMSAEPIRGMLEPCVDILHIARSDSICVKHTKNPVQTLTHSANRSTREQQFTSHEEYLKAWMPLVEMEAAAGAGYSDAAVTIHNVKVYMKTQNTGSFNLKSKFCTDRCISIGGKSPDSIPKETTRNQGEFPLDYVCLRYSTNCPERIRDSVKRADLTDMLDTHVTWLAHGGVMSVRKKGMKDGEGGYLNVNFHLSHISTPPPSSLMDKEGANVTLELLPKSEVDRRAQDLLLQLEDKGCELARALAYGDTLPSLGKRRRELGEDARYHDVEMPADGMSFIPMNNTRQLTAVRMALTNTLTLIQGPPGTGKTYTGIKLIYQFTRINRKLAKKGREPMAVLFCGPTNKAVDLVASKISLFDQSQLHWDCQKYSSYDFSILFHSHGQ